jgi:chromosome segregation ATPase
VVSDPDEAALEAVLDELDAAEARVRKAAFVAAELEEGLEEGEASRAELAAALDRLEAAEARLDELRRKRAEAEAELGRLGVLRVHTRRAGGG